MSYNSKQLKVQSSAKKLPKPKDVDYISKMGYRDDSPFRDNPYNDIYTPNGIIDMSQTGIPLFANGQYLPPYSGMHDMGTENVREIPVAKKGGQKGLKKFTSKNIQTSLNDIMQRNTTLFGSSGKKRYKPDLNYKYGGWLDTYQNKGQVNTSNWKKSSKDSFNLYNRGEEMVKWAKENPNFTTTEHNKKADELDIKYPVSSMPWSGKNSFIGATNWATLNSTKSGYWGVPLYDKPVGVQKEIKQQLVVSPPVVSPFVIPAPVAVPKVQTEYEIRENNFGPPIKYRINPDTKQYYPITDIPKNTKPEDITTIPFVNEMKKYGGWLDQYQDGSQTKANPLLIQAFQQSLANQKINEQKAIDAKNQEIKNNPLGIKTLTTARDNTNVVPIRQQTTLSNIEADKKRNEADRLLKQQKKTQGTLRETPKEINPNEAWRLAASNYQGHDKEEMNRIINSSKTVEGLGALAGVTGGGLHALASIPAVANTLGLGFAAHGVHSLPSTYRTLVDPNESVYNKARALTYNTADFLGMKQAAEALKGVGTAGKWAYNNAARSVASSPSVVSSIDNVSKEVLERRAFLQNLKDRKLIHPDADIAHFAQSDDLVSNLTKDVVNQKNTFYRGVKSDLPTDPKALEAMKQAGVDLTNKESIGKYYATHIKHGELDYSSGFSTHNSNHSALYTDPGYSGYGDMTFEMKKATDFSKGNYKDWIDDLYKYEDYDPNVFRNIDDVPEWTRTFRDSPNQIAPSKFVGKKGQKIFDNAKLVKVDDAGKGFGRTKSYELPGSSNAVEKIKNIEKPSWILHEPQTNSLQIKSTMLGSPLEKQLSKSGEISISNLKTHIGKAEVGQQDKFIIDKVLNEKFAGKTKIDYNDFRKAVSEELVPLEKSLSKEHAEYGVDRLGYASRQSESDIMHQKMLLSEINKNKERTIKNFERRLKDLDNNNGLNYNYQEKDRLTSIHNEFLKKINNQSDEITKELDKLIKNLSEAESTSLTYGNKSKFGKGSTDHFTDEGTLGHARTLVSKEEPDIMHVLEQQSDYFQKHSINSSEKIVNNANTISNEKAIESINKYKNAKKQLDGSYLVDFGDGNTATFIDKTELNNAINNLNKGIEKRQVINIDQKEFLGKNHQERLLQENVLYAVEQGKSKMRYPTSETAGKIQGYKKEVKTGDYNPLFNKVQEDLSVAVRQNNKQEVEKLMQAHDKMLNTPYEFYLPEHSTILKKYNEMPKMIKKVLGEDVKIVTDFKGNTWYEFNIPEKYKLGKAEIKAFKQGGQKSGWLDQYQGGGGPIKYETILGDDGKPMLNIQPEVEIIDNKLKSPLLIGTKGSFINSNGSDNVWDKVKQQWVAPPKYPGLQPQLTESKSKIPTRVEEIPSKRIIAPLTEIHKPIAESTGVPVNNAATINKKLDAAEMSKLAPFIAAEKRNQEATAVARYRNEQARANGTATGLYDEANEVRKYLYQQDKKKADEDRTAVMMAGLALAPAALYIAGVPAVSTALAVGSTMHGINAIPNTYSNWVAAANPNNETTWEDALGTTALNALDFWGTGQAFKQGNRVYNKGLNKFIESNSFVNQLKEPPISVYDRLLELKNVKPKVQPLTQFQKEQTVLKTENDFDNWFDENQNNMIYEQFAKSAHHDVNNANIYIDRALRNKYGPTHTLSSLDDRINRNPEFRLEALTKGYNAVRAQSNNFENWLTTSQRLKKDLREALNRPQTSFNWDKEKQLEISNLNEIKDVDKQSIDKVKKYMERPVEFTGTQGYSTQAILGPVHKIKNISSIPKTEDILDLIESFEKVYKKVKGQKTPIEQSLRIQLEDLTGTYWLRTTGKKELQDLGLNPKDLSVIDNGTGGSKNLVDPEGNIVGTVNLYNEESNFIHSTGVNHKFHGYKQLKSKNDKKNAEEKLIERLAKDKAIEDALTSHYNRHDPYNPHFEFSQGIYDELRSPEYSNLYKSEAEKKLMQLIDNNQNFYGDMLYRGVHHAIDLTRGPLSSNANFVNTKLPDPITNENIEAMRGAIHWGKGIGRGTYEQGPDGILRVIKKLGGEKWLNHNRSSKFVNSQNSNWLNKYQ